MHLDDLIIHLDSSFKEEKMDSVDVLVIFFLIIGWYVFSPRKDGLC